jgi:hypothetical protein
MKINGTFETMLVARLVVACGVALAVSLAVPTPAAAQGTGDLGRLAVSDTLYEVRLRGGESYVGQVVEVSPETLVLQTTAGVRIELAQAQIARIVAARGRVVEGQFWREDANRTRLFFSPTGRAAHQGTGYFGVYELFIPFVAYGLTDRVTIAGGSPFYFALLGDITPPVYIAPKVNFLSTPELDASIGALALYLPDDDADRLYGIVFGIATYGSPDHAITGGLGWGYAGTEIARRPAALLGGETRISRSIKIISENVFVPGEDGLVFSGGVRFLGERLSADAGLVGFIGGGDTTCCFPLVNFIWNFGAPR